MSFEEFTQCQVLADTDKLFVAAPQSFKPRGTGTTAIQLQAPLLLFLLSHHRDRYPVLEIIRLFVATVRKQLEYLDFKKTQTGVTRCFTNTRFAAKVLRAYGLLKFTHREAHKARDFIASAALCVGPFPHNEIRRVFCPLCSLLLV